jgi:filamentous hemagglutinin
MQGQYHLDDILTHPQSISRSNRFGGRDIFSPDGPGVRFDAENNFTGFLQPRRSN